MWLPPPFLSPPSLYIALRLSFSVSHPFLFFSHVTACFRGSEQKFLLASWLIPLPHPTPPHPTSTHLPSTTHLSSLTPCLTLLLSSLLVPRLPLLAARLEPSASFSRGRLPAVSINSLVALSLPLHLSTSCTPSFHRIDDVGVRRMGCFSVLFLFFFFLSTL